jgi:hypothetical protein
MSNNQTSINTNIKLPNQISLDTFYLTSLLLNYDISDQVYKSDEPNESDEIRNLKVVRRLLNIVLENKKYNMELLLNKFFEFVLWKNINQDQMIKMFCKKLNLDLDDENLEESKSSIEKYLKIIGERKITFKLYDYDEVYKKVNKILSTGIIKLNNDDVSHTGQPIPDPIKGRPQLDWGFCQYDGCKKSFSNCSGLVSHLIKCNVYTQGYHTSHEHGVNYNNLTIDKVINSNITKCPSWMCEIKNFGTAQELVQHLQLLGIKPFWKQGMTFCIESSKRKILEIDPDKKYINDTCVLCLDNPAEIIINKCGHQVYCIDCVCKANKINCPICRGKVDMFLPYA